MNTGEHEGQLLAFIGAEKGLLICVLIVMFCWKKEVGQKLALVFTRSTEQAIGCTNEIMEMFGCKTVSDLQKVDAGKLVAGSVRLGFRIWPERDGNYLPADLYEAYANGLAKDIDILQGCNKDETNYFVFFKGEESYNAAVLNRPEETIYTGRSFDETFSKTLRRMWIQFAKTGNPSLGADISPDGKEHEWPLYDLKNRQMMVFDEFNIHPERESERQILDWDKTYFLTKYYCI